MTLLRFLLTAVLALVASAALAHASLVGSEPADGATVASAPLRYVLHFNEPVSPVFLRLVDPSGMVTPLGDFHLEGQDVVVSPPAHVGRGSHALTWRVISADSHPVGGTVQFSIGEPSGTLATGESARDRALIVAIWFSRLVILFALFVGVGGALFAAFFAAVPYGAVRVIRAAIFAGAIALFFSVGLQGLDVLERPLAAIAMPDVWRSAMATSYGPAAVLAAIALGAAAAAFAAARTRLTQVFASVAIVALGASFAATGHASSAEPQPTMRLVVFAHVTVVAFWIGSLLPLWALLTSGDRWAALALRRFSVAAIFVVPFLLGAGFALAGVQMQSASAFLTTDYGSLLGLKLLLVAMLLGLASYNRWRLSGRAENADLRAQRRLASSIALEGLVALAILAVVAGWRFTPPPRALFAAVDQPISIHIHSESAMANLTLTSGRVGRAQAAISIFKSDATGLDAKGVTLILSNSDLGIEPIRREATRSADGQWRVDDLVLPAPGHWQAQVAILVSDFELVRLTEAIEIMPLRTPVNNRGETANRRRTRRRHFRRGSPAPQRRHPARQDRNRFVDSTRFKI